MYNNNYMYNYVTCKPGIIPNLGTEQLKPGIPGLESQSYRIEQWVSLQNSCDSAKLEARGYPARLVQVIYIYSCIIIDQIRLGQHKPHMVVSTYVMKLATCSFPLLANFLCWYAQDILQRAGCLKPRSFTLN